jgi:predicted DNA-binding transcriptional regulator YafY
VTDTAGRLLRLLPLLRARPTWRGDELAARLGVTTRTVRRDIWSPPSSATAAPCSPNA